MLKLPEPLAGRYELASDLSIRCWSFGFVNAPRVREPKHWQETFGTLEDQRILRAVGRLSLRVRHSLQRPSLLVNGTFAMQKSWRVDWFCSVLRLGRPSLRGFQGHSDEREFHLRTGVPGRHDHLVFG